MKAELHPQEGDRVAALRNLGVLDSEREADFDDVVEILSAVCEMPIALISLIDEKRQWFKASVGIDVPETPIDLSFCAHAILQPGIFLVHDTLMDSRFNDNPLVTGEPHLRFYASAPLETQEGLPVGTVCVLDTKPRLLDARQERLLKVMAKQVMAQLLLRREVTERKRAEHHQKLLNAELHHRVKNTIATVQAVVQLSLRTSDSLESFRQAIGARISSLANTHTMLTHYSWNATSFKDLVESELRPYDALGHVSTSGPDIRLSSQIAVTLGMVVHELVTNATKYGALSIGSGRVRLDWTTTPVGDGERLRIEWTETGGPKVTPPSRRGFGSMLLDRLLAHQLDGESRFEFHPDGLHFVADALVPHVALKNG
jgi:two-component sensor histidine kinase